MTSKNLARRLERLEAEIMPREEKALILHIQGVTPDPQAVSSMEFKVRIPRQPPKKRCGEGHRPAPAAA